MINDKKNCRLSKSPEKRMKSGGRNCRTVNKKKKTRQAKKKKKRRSELSELWSDTSYLDPTLFL